MVAPISALAAGAGGTDGGRGGAADVRRRDHVQLPAAFGARVRENWWQSTGWGGLGHLGVQFAARMGFRTVAIARGADKEALARQLGAAGYIDSEARDAAAELARMGGAKAILATVTSAEAMQSVIGGLGVGRDSVDHRCGAHADRAAITTAEPAAGGKGVVLRHCGGFRRRHDLCRAHGV